jgi:flagellar basal-body rod protein FlgB
MLTDDIGQAGTSSAFWAGMIDQLLGHQNYQLAKQLLDTASLRHEAIATNIANLETPGFKRLDISPDFARQLEKFAAAGPSADATQLRPTVVEDPNARAVRPDGNSVEIDRELIEMSRNTLEYDFLTQFASDSIKRLRTAITGRV